MSAHKFYIVMVGLPARGKSTVARKIQENLAKDGVRIRVFNNGDLRRQMHLPESSHPSFFAPENVEGARLRHHIAAINLDRARKYLAGRGRIAILDATNVKLSRRDWIMRTLTDHPVLFLECINNEEEILEASIQRKIQLPEFDHLDQATALQYFTQRIRYYDMKYTPVSGVRNHIKLDSLNNIILKEDVTDPLPHYDLIRDLLAADNVKNLFLARHGETFFNVEDRIGGDSPLTPMGVEQAERLGWHFRKRKIGVIFTSAKVRTIQTAERIQARQERCTIIPIPEFNEIDSGVCEEMSYREIKEQMPEVYRTRKADKFNYIYPRGEGYRTMRQRIERGLKKALYLSHNSNNIMIIGHRAANRMILSHFLYRREEDVPYIFIPQDKYYHIVSVHDRKLFQLKKF